MVIKSLHRERDWIGRWTGTTTQPLHFRTLNKLALVPSKETGGTHVKMCPHVTVRGTALAQLPASAIPFPVWHNLFETRGSALVSCMTNSCKRLSSPLLNETGWRGMPLSPQPLEVGHCGYYHGSKCAYGCVCGRDVSGGT